MSLRNLLLCTAFLAATAFSVTFAPATAQAQVVGGYSSINVADKGVEKAVLFAVSEKKARFAKVLKAESQVVAGRNYRLLLDVYTKDEVREAQVIVYAKLDGTLSLTSWTWTGKARPAATPVNPGEIDKAQLVVTNKLSGSVDMFWLDMDKEVSYGTLKAGETRTQGTFAGHEWIFRDARTKAIVKRFKSTGGRATLVLEEERGLPGGSSPIDVTDPQVVKAADFAVKSQKETLARIVRAEMQIVAGQNFHLTLEVRAKGGVREVQATVYAKLDGTLQLTKWTYTKDVRPELTPTDKAQLVVTNKTRNVVAIFWLDSGKAVSYGTIKPGETIQQDTFAGHEWIFRDATTNAILRRLKSPGGRAQVVLE